MAYKASKGVGERQLRNRTRDFQRMGGTISGGQIDVLVTQHLKTKSKEEREQIIKDALGHDLVMELPDRQRRSSALLVQTKSAKEVKQSLITESVYTKVNKRNKELTRTNRTQ